MTREEESLKQLRRERIARTKRILRWMPRRTNIHRYPGLRRFAKTARRNLDLWSFRVAHVIPALYAGCILAFWPLYGIQIPLSVLFALFLRANLPILFSLQFITNPVTIIPVYYVTYQIGRLFLSLLSVDTPQLNAGEIRILVQSVGSGDWILNLKYFFTVWIVTALGGTIIGSFAATIGSTVYRFMASEIAKSYRRLIELQALRKAAETKNKS